MSCKLKRCSSKPNSGSIPRTPSMGTLLTFVIITLAGVRARTLSASVARFEDAHTSTWSGKLNDNGPIIEVPNGRILGTNLTSRSGREYSGFYQIPYGEPPLGQLRFQPPRKYTQQWDGIRDCSSRGGTDVGCIQYTGYGLDGKEDCLNLNVFSPILPSVENPRPNLPVLVYIYGGAFKFGRASQLEADYIMDEDVVLVLPDFRVGPFGYLNTEDMEIRGNMAQKDQVLALKWIQENIEKFGGDPKRVLIFGNSSGGAQINGLIISRMAQGLFTRAISQSGTVGLTGTNSHPGESARQLGLELNCTNVYDTRELHQCLISAEAADLALAFFQLPSIPTLTKEAVPADGDLSEVFFEDHPLNLLRNGSFQRVPWLAGNNNAESFPFAHTILTTPSLVDSLNNNWAEVSQSLLNYEDDSVQSHSQALRDLYFGSENVSNATRRDLVNLLSDSQWVYPIKSALDLFAKGGGEAFYYYMTHEPVSSFGDAFKPGFEPPYGATHADEIQFLFPWTNELGYTFPYIGKDSPDYETSRNFVQIWTSFARDGYPSAPGVPTWPKLDGEDPLRTSWLELNDTCRLTDPLSARMALLSTIPFRNSAKSLPLWDTGSRDVLGKIMS